MDNSEALAFFSKLVEKDSSKGVEKYGHDTTDLDMEFMLRYTKSDSTILDIGSGTGLIINKIEPFIGTIDAIEPIAEFSKHIIKSKKVKVYNLNVFDFNTETKYDFITLFGFMHYFNEQESRIIYQNCLNWIKKDGRVIIKNQFGINYDVNVSGFSKELNLNYYAQYRQITKEIGVLKSLGFVTIDVVDIYPPDCNHWENTHFYAIIAKI